MKNKIGIMGGTFDPIHYGHLVLAEHVRSEYKLDTIIFVPAGKPPHKRSFSEKESDNRKYMTLLATVTNPNFNVSTVELDSVEMSYTVKTIERLKVKYGSNAELYFITGADALLDIETWKDFEQLLTMCHFIAGSRPGNDLKELEDKVVYLKKTYSADVDLFKVPALSISSTDIRNRVHTNQSIKYLVPEAVEQFIYKENIYK